MATSLLWEVIAKCLEGKKFASHTSVHTGSFCPDSYILDHWTLFDTASQYLSNSGSKVFFGARTYVFRFSKYGTYFKVTSTVWNHFCAANNRISTHLWVYFECFHRAFHSDTTFSNFQYFNSKYFSVKLNSIGFNCDKPWLISCRFTTYVACEIFSFNLKIKWRCLLFWYHILRLSAFQ